MAVNYTDFEKIWASTSPLTPYSFSDANYKRGWDFVGSTPPSRQMWDAFMQHADEKLQYLYLHEDVPVGHEYFTFNPNVPQGSLPLFGGEYSRETYSALWAWVQEQSGYLKTESEWQDLATANNGNVPYYSNGDGSTTFRVPSLKCWVKAANGTVTEVGSYKAAGLPNITGSFGHSATLANKSDTTTGAFSWNSLSQNRHGSTTAVNNGGTMEINASRSSSIYGNSSTVQPESIVGMWLVKAYGTIVDTGQIDEQQYIDDRIATCLPLTGGTMTGELTTTSAIVVKGTSTSRRDVTNSWNVVMGGTSDTNGAYLRLDGMDSNTAGSFTLKAAGGTNNSYLIGRPDGTLTWNSKEIERVNASGTNYIRFESGLQIVWGYTTATTAGTSVTFPVAFANTYYSVVPQTIGASLTAGYTSKTTTSVVIQSSHATTQAGVDYICIGKWK